MNCQWQSLLCQVEVGNLNMFAEDGEEDESRGSRVRSPQYTLQLRGCDVKAAPDGERPHRIALSTLGEQLAVLEVSGRRRDGKWAGRPAAAGGGGVTLALMRSQVSSVDEKRRWTRLLTAAADGGGETQQDTHIGYVGRCCRY